MVVVVAMSSSAPAAESIEPLTQSCVRVLAAHQKLRGNLVVLARFLGVSHWW